MLFRLFSGLLISFVCQLFILTQITTLAHANNPPNLTVQFSMPTTEYPFYHATLNFTARSPYCGKINQLKINEQAVADIYVFNSGKESYARILEENQSVRLIVRCDWRTNQRYRFEFLFSQKKNPVIISASATQASGYWNVNWTNYVAVVVTETFGIARRQEPVWVTLGLYASQMREPMEEIRVIVYDSEHPQADGRGYVEIPYQILTATSWENSQFITEKKNSNLSGLNQYDATTTVELVFMADVPASGSKVYLIFYGNPQAPLPYYATELKIRRVKGREYISNEYYMIGTTPESAALENITLIGHNRDFVFENKTETPHPLHWNPDIFIPPGPWARTSDWEKPEINKINGNLLFRISRSGTLGEQQVVKASVVYEFFANLPYMLVSSIIDVQEDIFVKALRNNQMVFSKALFDEVVWEDQKGKVRTFSLKNARSYPEPALKLTPDVAWLALVDNTNRVGLAMINVAFENGNLAGGFSSIAQPYFFIGTGPWQYWSRALIYPAGTGAGTRVMAVRKGSYYSEKMALLPFELGATAAPFAKVQQVATCLKNPLAVELWFPNDPALAYPWDFFNQLNENVSQSPPQEKRKTYSENSPQLDK